MLSMREDDIMPTCSKIRGFWDVSGGGEEEERKSWIKRITTLHLNYPKLSDNELLLLLNTTIKGPTEMEDTLCPVITASFPARSTTHN